MKCPLLAIGYLSALDQGTHRKCECLKGTCAWWSKSMEACCVPVLAANFIGLNETLLHLVDKMPHEE